MTTQIKEKVAISQFAKDVAKGLSQRPKRLSSKYFYDEIGDKLFQDIMAMPEYYLTNAEYEIFENHKADILNLFEGKAFDLIELGAGDGTKTKVLLNHFLEKGADFQYLPIDISDNALLLLENDLRENLPNLKVNPLQGDYFEVLEKLAGESQKPKVVLFLGANIGNFSRQQAVEFLEALHDTLNKGDLLLIGFDLKKDPATILDAYNDKAGITAAFNLNLLRRINRELGADFDLKAFKHWENYDPITGATRSFIVSTKKQKVTIEALDMAFRFEAWEAIDVELSQKYSLGEIDHLAEITGFETKTHFFDQRNYFVDAIWKA